jgi:hypothetical protein
MWGNYRASLLNVFGSIQAPAHSWNNARRGTWGLPVSLVPMWLLLYRCNVKPNQWLKNTWPKNWFLDTSVGVCVIAIELGMHLYVNIPDINLIHVFRQSHTTRRYLQCTRSVYWLSCSPVYRRMQMLGRRIKIGWCCLTVVWRTKVEILVHGGPWYILARYPLPHEHFANNGCFHWKVSC